MPSRQELQQALIDAATALRDSLQFETVCGPIGNGLWIAMGTPEGIRAHLPPSAANDSEAPPQVPI